MKVAPIYDFLRTIEWWMLSGTFALIWAFFSLSKFNYNAPHHLLRTMDWNMLSRGIQQSPLDHTYTNKQLTFFVKHFFFKEYCRCCSQNIQTNKASAGKKEQGQLL